MSDLTMAVGGDPAATESTAVLRDAPDVDPARRAMVAQWIGRIQSARKKYEDGPFKRMRADMAYARLGASQEWVDGKNYVVPIINRHVNQAVASLYAKDPRVEVRRRKRLMHPTWDGSPESVQQAVEEVAMAAQQGIPPEATAGGALLAEVSQVQAHNQMLDRVAKTLETLFDYYTSEQDPNFKVQMKQTVRRTKVTGVGYMWLDFQRQLEPRPEITAQLADITSKLTAMERLTADVADGEVQPEDADVEQLRTLQQDLMTQEYVIVREGPVFDFPRSTEIIVDPACRQLQGLVGAGWIAREMHMPPSRVQEVYKVDVGKHFRAYVGAEDGKAVVVGDEKAREKGMACVWRVFNRETQQEFTVCDGWPDFLKGPAVPDVQLERFWPLFTLVFNAIEDEEELFPPSDVFLLRDPQDEYNRSRQGLREHRHANRPKYFTVKGRLEEEDKAALRSHAANSIIELNALATGETIEGLIQPHKPVPIDPAQYETKPLMEDIYRSVGEPEHSFGGASGATATEVSAGEMSRMTTASSNVDDLDEFLTDFARAFGQLVLLNLSAETVKKIAGPGAVWPEYSAQDVAEEIELVTRAGSSGRPNRAAELANMERGMPFLLQMPGVNPEALGRKYADLLEMDPEELFMPGLPSITALNSMLGKGGGAQPGTGDPATDPGQQGAAGADNGERAPGTALGGQPAYPAGGSGAQKQDGPVRG